MPHKSKRFLAFMYAVCRHNDPELFITFLQPNIQKIMLLIKIRLNTDDSFLLVLIFPLFTLMILFSNYRLIPKEAHGTSKKIPS